jgi:heat shock protein HslJ
MPSVRRAAARELCRSADGRSKTMKWMAVLSFVVCVLATGCESNSGDGADTGNLAGTKWRLAAWSASSLDPTRFTITADFSETSISGSAAVNTYGGPYTATADGAFSAGPIHATVMAGSADAMRAESLYFDLLGQARNYEVVGSMLILRNEGNQDVLIFQARDDDYVAFVGTVKWQVLEGGFYAIDADDGQKYEPINLPSEYQVNGLRVRVTAIERDDMASINMYGTIIEIISISEL